MLALIPLSPNRASFALDPLLGAAVRLNPGLALVGRLEFLEADMVPVYDEVLHARPRPGAARRGLVQIGPARPFDRKIAATTGKAVGRDRPGVEASTCFDRGVDDQSQHLVVHGLLACEV